MFNIESLIDAALQEAPTGKAPVTAPPPAKSEFQKLADVLEKAAKEGARPENAERFNKLAMAVILDTMDDPKAKKGLEALTHDIMKTSNISGGVMNEKSDPGTVGEVTEGTGNRTRVLEKHRVDKGRTLFKKLQGNTAPGPATEDNS